MIHLRRTFAFIPCRSVRRAGLPIYQSLAALVFLFSLIAILLTIVPEKTRDEGTTGRPRRRLIQDALVTRSNLNRAHEKRIADLMGKITQRPISVSQPSKISFVSNRASTGGRNDQYITTSSHVESMNTAYQRPQAEPQRKQRITQSRDLKTLNTIWDISQQEDDRIVQQLNYVPREWKTSRPVHILVFNMQGDEQVPEGRDKFVADGCRVDNCYIMTVPSPHIHVDALLTSVRDLQDLDLKRSRRPEDIWIYYSLESPRSPTAAYEDDIAADWFNWTATYRHDSTIVTPYEKWVPFPNSSQNLYLPYGWAHNMTNPKGRNYASGKTKMAAAIISNCEPMGRMQVIQELMAQNVSVDIYGACGQPCDNCFQMVQANYKFYLSFENSNCIDYITEKFFRNALQFDTVPIVFGARPFDYRRSAPPMSYIHVEEFPTMRHLADYMRVLDSDDDLYNAYFRWKGTGSFINTKFWCRLCAMLNDPDKPQLEVISLTEWWVKGSHCREEMEPWGGRERNFGDVYEEQPEGEEVVEHV